MMTMALQLHHLPLVSSYFVDTHFLFGYYNHQKLCSRTRLSSLCLHGNSNGRWRRKRKKSGVLVGQEDIELRVADEEDDEEEDDDDEEDALPPSPEELQYIEEIKRVLNLLKKNRDMMFNEVKLTIAIEDPREVERRRLLGIEDLDAPTREDLAEALEQVNEGKVPKNRVALKMLAEEMVVWPNLEVEITKTKPKKSLYARVTDIGVDPREAAKRLNVDWDSAAEIEEVDKSNETEVPAVLGYGALYLVSAFPVIIGISVVLILFYNSLQ